MDKPVNGLKWIPRYVQSSKNNSGKQLTPYLQFKIAVYLRDVFSKKI